VTDICWSGGNRFRGERVVHIRGEWGGISWKPNLSLGEGAKDFMIEICL